MADTSIKDETVVTDASKTAVTTPVTPPAEKTEENAELAAAKKEAEQARMRANQLENENKKLKEADEEAKRKQLEENEEWKSLAEQEKAKREALETEKEAETRSKELQDATKEIFSKFSPEVIELAEETGIGLTDGSDEDKAKLQATLEKVSAKIVSKKPVTANNPGEAATSTDAELLQRMRAGDRDARTKVVGNLDAVKAMRRMAGLGEE